MSVRDPKPRLASWCWVRDLNRLNLCRSRPGLQPGEHLTDGCFVAFDRDFNGAIRAVASVAGKTETGCQRTSGVPKPNALHAAVHDGKSADHTPIVLHSR